MRSGFVNLVLPTAQDVGEYLQRKRVGGKRRDVHRGERRPSHRVYIRQRVRGSDLPEVVRVIDYRREEVDGLHEHDVVGHAKDPRVVERFVADENARIRLSRERRERVRQVRRTHLGRSAGAARELGQAERLFAGVRHGDV